MTGSQELSCRNHEDFLSSVRFDAGAKRPRFPSPRPCRWRLRDATHPEAPRVQHLGVAGKVHPQGPVVADSHRDFLQGLVPTV